MYLVFFSDPCCVAVAEHGESTAVAEGGGGAEVVVSDGSLFLKKKKPPLIRNMIECRIGNGSKMLKYQGLTGTMTA